MADLTETGLDKDTLRFIAAMAVNDSHVSDHPFVKQALEVFAGRLNKLAGPKRPPVEVPNPEIQP